MSLAIRPYTLNDWDGLFALQKAAFPPPYPEEQLWRIEQIKSHIEIFPQGAITALIENQIVGSCTSVIIKYDGKHHTWYEVSDNGYIRNSHIPDGDSLYGIDLCVHPSFRNQGIARAMYKARKELVTKLNLKRFIAGCRIPDFYKYAKNMDCVTYVEKVAKGEIHDTVLTFMLKQGLTLLQIIDEYLEDEESLNKGVLVEWCNPNY